MKRTPLLIEQLVTLQKTRPGPIYLYRRPQGPKPASKEKINRFLHQAGHRFDFGPIMTGDQQQARQIAEEYFAHLKKSAKQQNIPLDTLKERLKEISPHLKRGLLTFFTYFDGKLKAGS